MLNSREIKVIDISINRLKNQISSELQKKKVVRNPQVIENARFRINRLKAWKV